MHSFSARQECKGETKARLYAYAYLVYQTLSLINNFSHSALTLLAHNSSLSLCSHSASAQFLSLCALTSECKSSGLEPAKMHYAYIQLTVPEIAGQSESPCSRRRQGRVCRAWSAWWAGECGLRKFYKSFCTGEKNATFQLSGSYPVLGF